MSFITIITSLTTALRTEYLNLWNQAKVKPNSLSKVEAAYQRLLSGKPRYEKVAQIINLPGIPWYLIGVIHMRESTFNFTKHLHNGDSLTGRTINVPAGRPISAPANGWASGYTWEESATDAIAQKLKESPSWYNYKNDSSVESLLNKIEAYNGAGYRKIANPIPSPYLWADSTVQQPGKFTADGVFSSNTTDSQIGAGTLLKYFLEQEAKKKSKPAG